MNENTPISGGAKVSHWRKAMTIVPSGLGNRNGDKDSSDECNINESSDSSRLIEIFSMHSCSTLLSFVCFLRPAGLVFFYGIHIIFHLPHFARPAARKTKLQKVISLP